MQATQLPLLSDRDTTQAELRHRSSPENDAKLRAEIEREYKSLPPEARGEVKAIWEKWRGPRNPIYLKFLCDARLPKRRV